MRHRDRRSAGSSKLVPYRPGEEAADRHWRRLGANLGYEEEVRKLADERGLTLLIRNDGQHWTFKRPGFTADWWPSSAKLVFNQQWKRGVHCHDWRQVFREIDKQ